MASLSIVGVVALLALEALLACAIALLLVRRARRRAREASLTDPLTGLATRHRLVEDHGAEHDGEGPGIVVGLFDLDGFKSYNDTFGHPAGDALLRRLSQRLGEAVGGRGSAYRMGGDEFCVVTREQRAADVLSVAQLSLGERGVGFAVRCSLGRAEIPEDAADLEGALLVADRRLYRDKQTHRGQVDRAGTVRARVHNAVLGLLGGPPSAPVAGALGEQGTLAAATAERLGLGPDQVTRIRTAADLHDIGRAALPESLLEKPTELDAEERELARRHVLIGERIIGAMPELREVARLVRSSHERIDGDGYPDGLAGDAIPLGARVICVVDAFLAMVSARSYRPAMGVSDALAELRACSGTQFDATVVRAFSAVIEDELRAVAPAAGKRSPALV